MTQNITEQIEFTNNQYTTLQKIAKVYDQTVTEYLHDVIFHAVKLELENTDGLGAAFCSNLKALFEKKESEENVS